MKVGGRTRGELLGDVEALFGGAARLKKLRRLLDSLRAENIEIVVADLTPKSLVAEMLAHPDVRLMRAVSKVRGKEQLKKLAPSDGAGNPSTAAAAMKLAHLRRVLQTLGMLSTGVGGGVHHLDEGATAPPEYAAVFIDVSSSVCRGANLLLQSEREAASAADVDASTVERRFRVFAVEDRAGMSDTIMDQIAEHFGHHDIVDAAGDASLAPGSAEAEAAEVAAEAKAVEAANARPQPEPEQQRTLPLPLPLPLPNQSQG